MRFCDECTILNIQKKTRLRHNFLLYPKVHFLLHFAIPTLYDHQGDLSVFGCPAGFTYFYKGKEYWKFNNHRLRVEPGYPRSILKDFMGCDLTPIDPDRQPKEDVDIVIKLDNEGSTVKAIAIVIPCVLAVCLVVLIYTVFQFKRKGTPRHILYCKRSMQEWV